MVMARLTIDIYSKSRSKVEVKVRNMWKIVSVTARPVSAKTFLNDDEYEIELRTCDGATIIINMNTPMLFALYGMLHNIIDKMSSFHRFYELEKMKQVIENDKGV